MLRRMAFPLLLTVLLITCSQKAYGQVSASVGVHGGYEFEYGGRIVGGSGFLDVGFPVKVGMSVDYLSINYGDDLQGRDHVGHVVLGGKLRADLLPRFLPVGVYVVAGPAVFRRTACDDQDCTKVGGEAGFGAEATVGILKPFMEAGASRGTFSYYSVRGGLRVAF